MREGMKEEKEVEEGEGGQRHEEIQGDTEKQEEQARTGV